MKDQQLRQDAGFLWELNQYLTLRSDAQLRIPTALKRLGARIEADLVAVLHVNRNMQYAVAYQWGADSGLQSADSSDCTFLFNKEMEELLGESYIIDVNSQDEEVNACLRDILGNLGIERGVFLPMTISSHVFSFLIYGIKSHRNWEPPVDFMLYSALTMAGILEREYGLAKVVQHQALFQDFIDNPFHCLLRMDASFRINYANKKTASLFEKHTKELHNMSLFDLLPEAHSYRKHLENIIHKPGEVVTFEVPIVTEDSVYYIEWNAYPVYVAENLPEVHVIGHDVTNHREESLALNHILEEMWAKSEKKN